MGDCVLSLQKKTRHEKNWPGTHLYPVGRLARRELHSYYLAVCSPVEGGRKVPALLLPPPALAAAQPHICALMMDRDQLACLAWLAHWSSPSNGGRLASAGRASPCHVDRLPGLQLSAGLLAQTDATTRVTSFCWTASLVVTHTKTLTHLILTFHLTAFRREANRLCFTATLDRNIMKVHIYERGRFRSGFCRKHLLLLIRYSCYIRKIIKASL